MFFGSKDDKNRIRHTRKIIRKGWLKDLASFTPEHREMTRRNAFTLPACFSVIKTNKNRQKDEGITVDHEQQIMEKKISTKTPIHQANDKHITKK